MHHRPVSSGPPQADRAGPSAGRGHRFPGPNPGHDNRPASKPGFRGGIGGKAEVTIQALATVQLKLESRPESVTLVRSMLAGLGQYLELDAELMDYL